MNPPMDRREIQEETGGGTLSRRLDPDNAGQILPRENLVGAKTQEQPQSRQDYAPGRDPEKGPKAGQG